MLLSVKQKSRHLDQKEGGMLSLGKKVKTLFCVKQTMRSNKKETHRLKKMNDETDEVSREQPVLDQVQKRKAH